MKHATTTSSWLLLLRPQAPPGSGPWPSRRSRHPGAAFTLTELLVAIAIILLMVGALVPMVGAVRLSRVQAGTNTFTTGAQAARVIATRDITFLKTLTNPGGFSGHGQYSGTAILITPSNEMRLVENDQDAVDGSGNYLELKTPPPPRNGYKDVKNREYISIPRGTGVVGLTRNSAGDPILYAPPFAIRFDEHGHLISGQPSADDRVVFYDGNYNDEYTVGNDRPADYNPKTYDPEQSKFAAGNFITTGTPPANKYLVPFEKIETVVGVIVFDKGELYDTFGEDALAATSGGAVNDNARNWILANGRALFFNRYTGTVIRND